jgi:hypothetical protein
MSWVELVDQVEGIAVTEKKRWFPLDSSPIAYGPETDAVEKSTARAGVSHVEHCANRKIP